MAWFAGCESRWNWKAFSVLMTGLFLLPCLYLIAAEGISTVYPFEREAEDRPGGLSNNTSPGFKFEDLLNADGDELSVEDLWIDGERFVFVLSTACDPPAHPAEAGVPADFRGSPGDE